MNMLILLQIFLIICLGAIVFGIFHLPEAIAKTKRLVGKLSCLLGALALIGGYVFCLSVLEDLQTDLVWEALPQLLALVHAGLKFQRLRNRLQVRQPARRPKGRHLRAVPDVSTRGYSVRPGSPQAGSITGHDNDSTKTVELPVLSELPERRAQ